MTQPEPTQPEATETPPQEADTDENTDLAIPEWPLWAHAYVAHIATGASVGDALRLVDKNRSTVKRLRDRDPSFVEAEHDAYLDAVDRARRIAYQRGTLGELFTRKTVKKLKDGTIEETEMTEQRISDMQLLEYLRAHAPEYRRGGTVVEHVGDGAVVVTQQTIRTRSPQRLEELLGIAQELGWSPEPDVVDGEAVEE